MEDLLLEVEGSIRPAEVGVDGATALDSVLFAKEIRNRYTVLQLLWDLHLLEPYADRVVEYLYGE